MATNFPLDAHQDSITLAMLANRAHSRGCALRGVDAEGSQEALLEAWDHAREAGVVCGTHDLTMPFALTQLPSLLPTYRDGEEEGVGEREALIEARLELYSAAA